MDRDNGTARLPPSLSSSPAANALANHLSAQPRTPRTPNVDDDLSSRFWRGFRGLRGTQEEDPRVPTRHTDTRLPARQTDSSPIPATSWLTPSPRHTVGPYRANMQAIREDTWRRFNEGGQLVPLDREYHLAANFFENLSIDSHQGRLLTAPFFKGDANIRWGPAAIHPRWSFNPALRTPLPIQLRGINFRERLIRTPISTVHDQSQSGFCQLPYDILSIVLDWLPTSSEILLGITCKKLLLDLDSRAVRFLNAGAEVKYVTRNGILKEGKLSAKETNKIKKDMLVLYSKDLPDLYVCFDKDCRTHLHPMTSFGRLGCWKSAGFIRYPPIFFHHVQAVMRPIHAARTTGSTIAIKLEQLPVVRDTWMTGSPADYRDELEARWDGIRRTETRTSFKIVQGRLLMKAEARQYRRWVGDSTTVDWKTKKTTPWAQLSRHGGCNHQYFVSQAAQASANSYEKEGELFMKTAKTYHRELRGRDEIEYMSRLSRCGWCAKEAQFDLRITADDLNWNIKLTTWTDLGPGLSPEDNPWKSIREDNKLHDPFGNISAPYLPHSVMHTQSIKESFEQVNEVRGQVLLHVGIPLMERGRDPVPQANWTARGKQIYHGTPAKDSEL